MGRHKNTTRLNPVVAVHEAGHAVGRILAADQLGQAPEKVISYIEIGGTHVVARSAFDPSMVMKLQATVYGPTLSEDLQATFNRVMASTPRSQQLNRSHIAAALKVARDEGLNVENWLRGSLEWS